MVVRRGVNEESVLPMAREARERGYILRFIEYMDVGHTNGWEMAEVVPAAEMVTRIDRRAAPRAPRSRRTRARSRRRWRYRDGGGDRRHRLGHADPSAPPARVPG